MCLGWGLFMCLRHPLLYKENIHGTFDCIIIPSIRYTRLSKEFILIIPFITYTRLSKERRSQFFWLFFILPETFPNKLSGCRFSNPSIQRQQVLSSWNPEKNIVALKAMSLFQLTSLT